jgi:hypothetical protein
VILVQAENELQEGHHVADDPTVLYMQQVEDAFRDAGIVVPLTHNEKGMRSQSWSTDYQNVGGAVDVYALDSYPGGLSCTNNATGFKVVRNYYQWFQNYSYTQPEYLAEFEGGWFSGSCPHAASLIRDSRMWWQAGETRLSTIRYVESKQLQLVALTSMQCYTEHSPEFADVYVASRGLFR